jgi:type IV pilus modification protein PilV
MRTFPYFRAASRAQLQRGFSLVELLLTAFILSIGLLGLAALQASAMRGHLGSKTRDAAAYFASSVLDRLKADGQVTAAQRLNNQAISPAAILASAPLDTQISYQAPNSSGTLQSQFNIRGGPLEPTSGNLDESTPMFTANFVVRSNGKDGDPAPTSQGMTREVVVNVTWQEAVSAAGATTLQSKSISMSRYIRF